jgi:hypothetical protein
MGICLKKFKSENNVVVVSTTLFPAGMYIVELDDKTAIKVFKR